MAQSDECKLHESRIDDMDMEVHKQSGWLKTAAVVFSIVGTGLIYIGSNVNNKLDSISSLLTESKVVLMQHSEQIKQLQGDVKELQDRTKYQQYPTMRTSE